MSLNTFYKSYMPFASKILQVSCIDPSLGRLDYDSLSDQALMEMLVKGMNKESKRNIQDAHGNFDDVCEWGSKLLQYTRCINDRVTRISMVYAKWDEKQFPFDFIPPLVTQFIHCHGMIHGTLDTASLPVKLEKLDVSYNVLHGELNIEKFPRTLEKIEILANDFCGSIVLADLPPGLIHFEARRNKFTGEVSLSSLPLKMRELKLGDNNLMGSIHIDSLPERMQEIDLSMNAFTGEFRLLVFPPHLRTISIGSNRLNETLVLGDGDGVIGFILLFSDVKSVVDKEGKTHPWEETIIRYNQRDLVW